MASPSNGHEQCIPPRRVRGGGVHGTITRLQVKFIPTCGLPTQEASLQPQASAMGFAHENSVASRLLEFESNWACVK